MRCGKGSDSITAERKLAETLRMWSRFEVYCLRTTRDGFFLSVCRVIVC